MTNKKTLSLALIGFLVLSCKEAGTTDTGPVFDLKAPENPSVLRLAQKAVRITWTDTSVNEEGFEVERKTNTGDFAGRLYTTRNLAAAVDSMNLSIDSTYTYRVRALRYEQKGPYSPEVLITLTP